MCKVYIYRYVKVKARRTAAAVVAKFLVCWDLQLELSGGESSEDSGASPKSEYRRQHKYTI